LPTYSDGIKYELGHAKYPRVFRSNAVGFFQFVARYNGMQSAYETSGFPGEHIQCTANLLKRREYG
jgi:hypothetical protein